MTTFKTTIVSLSFLVLFANTTNMHAMEPKSSAIHAFWCALWDEDFDLAQRFLNCGDVGINTLNDHGETPLLEATISGNLACVDFLSSGDNRAHVDLEATNQDGKTALKIAVEIGHIDIAQLLISRGASTSKINFAQLLGDYKKKAAHQAEHASYMCDEQDENHASYGDNYLGHNGKRGAAGVGEFQSILTKRSRVTPEQEELGDAREEYGTEPEFANGRTLPQENLFAWYGNSTADGGPNLVHQVDCLYSYPQNSQDNKQGVPFGTRPQTFVCENCTYINAAHLLACSVCGQAR